MRVTLDYECEECGHDTVVWDGEEDFDDIVVHCPECGAVMYIPKEDEDDYDEDDDIPEGCAACGGPYPKCMSSCKLFDD